MDENIKEYRDKAIKVVKNSYVYFAGFELIGINANLVANNDLVELLKLGRTINKDLVINNIECGTHDEKLKLYFNKDENKQNNSVKIQKKFEDYKLQQRYEELIKAVNNDMPLSFFWLAGSIIEGVLCEYCKNNNIQSSKNDIDGYITALENNKRITKRSTIYTTLQHFRQFRNTIHPNNENNDFINDKNLQSRKEDLDDVINYFTY